MPPKVKFDRPTILKTAVDLVRDEGMRALTARNLSSRLGCSVKPLFSSFSGMEELQSAVLEEAYRIYMTYLDRAREESRYPLYKSMAMGYIGFAKEEPALFRLCFMRNRRDEAASGETDQSFEQSVSVLMDQTGLSHGEATRFHLESWVYVHGLATMITTGFVDWEEEDISRSLTDVYQGLLCRFLRKGESNERN